MWLRSNRYNHCSSYLFLVIVFLREDKPPSLHVKLCTEDKGMFNPLNWEPATIAQELKYLEELQAAFLRVMEAVAIDVAMKYAEIHGEKPTSIQYVLQNCVLLLVLVLFFPLVFIEVFFFFLHNFVLLILCIFIIIFIIGTLCYYSLL
eukprot:m.106286 g.106286  ORF g.106286 m.106286 type:complete len:148 (-) comp9150_c1_seq5:114-557(-)